VAKIETGKMTLEEVPTDIRRTVGEATRMWQDQAAAKGLAFSVDLTNGPYCAIADGTRLRQIVFNLLSNAVKFTPEGAVTVTSAIVGDRWQLKVSDTGIGVAPEKQEIIFEAFRQADTGTTRQFGGTGLGLSICRNLSRAMGGDVTVTSVEGQGATFMLELPYEPVEPAEAGAVPGEGVLVVDRNPITRAMFKALLSPAGGPVSFAGTMAEAAEATATRKPAIVLIDDATMRTAEDHLALVRRIADDAPDAKLALLGPALSAGEERELQAAGVVQFIAKPIGKEALVEALLHDEPRVTALVSEAA
jgi:CheY-like chemotaxis protein